MPNMIALIERMRKEIGHASHSKLVSTLDEMLEEAKAIESALRDLLDYETRPVRNNYSADDVQRIIDAARAALGKK